MDLKKRRWSGLRMLKIFLESYVYPGEAGGGVEPDTGRPTGVLERGRELPSVTQGLYWAGHSVTPTRPRDE